jgi:hypothetical protein
MIQPRSTEAKLYCLDMMIEAIIKPHHSHESRNSQLAVVRALIDDWAKEFSRYISEDDRKAQAPETLDTVYYLCIWQLDHETHSCVRQRLYLARSVLLQYRRRAEEIREEGRRAEPSRRTVAPMTFEEAAKHLEEKYGPDAVRNNEPEDIPF